MSEVYVNEPSTGGKVVLHTSLGDLDIELWSRECPVACRNFLQLCCDGYYNGLIFHRVIKDFIVQTGDPTGTGRGGSDTAVNNGRLFDLEIHPRLKFRYRGLVGVANLTGSAPAGVAGGRGCGTNGNQFFITLSRCDALNNTHTLFGKVTGHSLYNLMKFGELEIGKDDRPVYPPVIKGVDVLWMPFPDIQPRFALQQQPDKGSSSGRGDGEEEGAGREEQQKSKLQKPDKKLLSFAEEEEEDEEEGGDATAAEGKKNEQQSREGQSSSRDGRPEEPPAAAAGRTGSNKKILSAHDVLEDDPLLQKSSGAEVDAGAWKTEARRADASAGTGSEFPVSEEEEEEKRWEVGRRQRKRRRSSNNRSSSSEHSSDDSSGGHSSDDSRSRPATRNRGDVARSRDARDSSSRGKEADEGGSSTLSLVRNKLAALAADEEPSSGSSKRHRHAGSATGAGGAGGEAACSGSRKQKGDDRSSRSGRHSGVDEEQQRQRDKEGTRKVEALRLWTGGGSASRGAHADRERLQDSDLMSEREKKWQLHVLRKRDTGRQREQTDTLKKLDAFTQQLRSLRERHNRSSTAESSSAAGGDSSSGSKGQEKGRDSLNSSGGGPRKDSGARPTGGTADKPNTAEPGTLNAMLPDLDEEIDENDGSWLSGGGLRFAVDSNRAYELDEARAAASVVVYDPLRGAGELAAQKMQQRRQQQAIAWKEGQRNIEKW